MDTKARGDFKRSKSDGTEDATTDTLPAYVRKHSRHHSADLMNFFGHTPPSSPKVPTTPKALAFFGHTPMSPASHPKLEKSGFGGSHSKLERSGFGGSHSKLDRKGSSDLRVTFADETGGEQPTPPPRRVRNRPLSDVINLQPSTPPPFLIRPKSDFFPSSVDLEVPLVPELYVDPTDPGTLPRAMSTSTIPHERLTTRNEDWNRFVMLFTNE